MLPNTHTRKCLELIAGSLEDSHILDLSKRITNGEELEELGIKALKLPEFIIKSALYNHSQSIQSAAHDVLSTWLKQQQGDRHTAYTTLRTALQKCDDLKSMAAELEIWVMGTVQESHISQDSMYPLLYTLLLQNLCFNYLYIQNSYV